MDRKAVIEIMITATHASMWCQVNSQTVSNVPWYSRPVLRTMATSVMNRFKDRKMPMMNF